MKKFFSLITALVLCTAMWGQTAFYQLPNGVFLSGMTDDGDVAVAAAELHAPHISGGEYKFTSETKGSWKSGNADSKTYTLTSKIMKAYKIPHLTVGESQYQYGSKNGTYTTNSYFYVGDSLMHSMTPAKLYGASGTTPYTTYVNYKTTVVDTIGVYFNNIGVMYIDSISIPVRNNTSGVTKKEQLFPEGSHVILTIYKATSAGGKSENKLDRETILYTDELTIANYKIHSSGETRGALNKKFSKPISIDGPFVIELRDMKHSGCSFSVYCSKERENENLWGYYFSEGKRTFPSINTPLISVHAMFPVLEKQDAEKTLEFTSEGGDDAAAIISNFNPTSEDFTIDFGEADWISTKSITNADDYKTTGKSTLTFTAAANTGEAREATITLKHHGKVLTYTVSQEAAAVTKYYAKNNWNGAAEWSWLELVPSTEDNVYMLDTIVFGGTGVYINDKADDADALYFAAEKIVVLNVELDGIPTPYIPEPRKHDTIPYAPARSGIVLEAPTLLAGDTIKLFFYAADSTLKAFIIGRPAPAEEGYGIIFSDGKTIKGQKNEAQTEYLEYIIEAELTATTTFQLYDFASKASWTETNIDEASTPFLIINGGNVYEVTADGKYTLYLKMYGPENNQVYCAYEGSATNFNKVKAAQGQRYNILGLPVDANYRGVVIMNGQTYLQ